MFLTVPKTRMVQIPQQTHQRHTPFLSSATGLPQKALGPQCACLPNDTGQDQLPLTKPSYPSAGRAARLELRPHFFSTCATRATWLAFHYHLGGQLSVTLFPGKFCDSSESHMTISGRCPHTADTRARHDQGDKPWTLHPRGDSSRSTAGGAEVSIQTGITQGTRLPRKSEASPRLWN